ncbi:long-chain-fatty-acid--CoA ligase [Streptomyces sp. NPDC058953]|uniref:long-chain-fatty-acid--CoA ligase n=1 Tax=unclassified Streptomyces TaxID=2593676 RepID=UPI0036A03BD1
MYLTQALHRALQQAPDRAMTVCGDRVRTTRETVDRVSRLGGGLRGLGVAEGDRVAVLARNSDRYHELFFASWWIGAAVNPVNLRWSTAEIVYGLDDSGSKVLLVDEAFASLVPELRKRCPRLTTVLYCGEGSAPDGTHGYEELISAADPVDDVRAGGDALAALLYTGGTTGSPKGVMVGHRGLMTSTLGAQATTSAAVAGGTLLVSTPMFHIAALVGWMGQIIAGGTVVFLPSFSTEGVLEALDRHRVTSIGLVPTMMQMLIDHPAVGRYDLDSVRRVGYGASPISETTLTRAMEVFPRAEFRQLYGMTETAVVTVLGPDEHRAGGRLLRSAGRAAPHCEVRVVDPDGSEVPPGRAGELICRGDNLMLGYWNKPEETAAVLREGWMHTGDGATMDEDGYVFITDRIKDMIITGGENVYSAEVENALARHPAVASCAVIGVPDERWGERVHAVVVLKPGTTATPAELRDHTARSIAGYKTPRTVEFTDALPVSGAGKILKRELRARYSAPGAPSS